MSSVVLTDVFPPGTVAVFGQTTAPIGWTKVTSYNGHALQVTNSAGGSAYSAGIDFATAHQSYSVAGATTTLTSSDNPDHYHNSEEDTGGSTRTSLWTNADDQVHSITSQSVGGGTHVHGTVTVDLRVNYTDVILASKG
jgi:hypothetical protein